MEIKFDKGVDLTGVQPEILLGMTVVKEICQDNSVRQIRITSVVRKQGRGRSLHPDGKAIDFKIDLICTYTPQMEDMLKLFKAVLDEQFDIIYHQDSDGEGKHFHIEFDPK